MNVILKTTYIYRECIGNINILENLQSEWRIFVLNKFCSAV